MDKLEIKKGNSVKFADLIDDGKKNDNTIYYVTDEKKIHLADMVLEDTENVKTELNTTISNNQSTLNSKIDTVNSSLSATIENNVNALNSTISNNYNTLNTKINTKQDTLVSGQNIKTIGNEPVIGSGNIIITPQQAFTVNENILSISGHSGYEWIGKKTSEKRNVLWIGTSIPA
jgi:hypothetical protein